MAFCEQCGKQTREDASLCDDCAAVGVAMPENQKKRGRKRIIISVIVVTVVAIVATLIVGLCTNWFGLVSPLDESPLDESPLDGLIKAFDNTLHADNLTLDMGDDIEVLIDWGRKGDGPVLIMDNPGADVSLLKDGTWYDRYVIDGYLCAYIEDDDGTISNFLKVYADATGTKEINYEDLIDETGLDEYVDGDEIQPFLKEFYKTFLCDTKWLEKTAGFEKEGNTYIFRPDVDALCDDLIDFCSQTDLLTDDAEDALESIFGTFSEGLDDEIIIEITVDGDYISEIKFNAQFERYDETITLKIKDVNKTDAVKEAEKISSEAEAWIEDNVTICPTCGEMEYPTNKHFNCPN